MDKRPEVPLPDMLDTLKALRLYRKRSLRQAAEVLGLSSSGLSLIESGDRSLSLQRAADMAALYEVDLDTIYKLYRATRKQKKEDD